VELIQVKNRVSRQIITDVDILIDAAFSDDDNKIKAKLSEAIFYYKEAMKLVLLHHELMEEEGNTFQDLIDDSFFNVGRSVWCGGYH
jgi:hypothetical protein